MYVKYGNLQFAPGEAVIAGINLVTNRSSRGFNMTQSVMFHVSGEVCQQDADKVAITNRLQEIFAEISQNGKDIGVYLSDNSQTYHYLQSNHPNNLTGNQIRYQNFPAMDPMEYIDGRKFSFGVGAEILGVESSIFEYSDSIRQINNGGPDVDWVYEPGIGWVLEQRSPTTFVTYIHTGHANVLSSVPFTPPPPYFNIPFWIPKLSEIGNFSPERKPQGYMGRLYTWKYVYRVPAPNIAIVPTIR